MFTVITKIIRFQIFKLKTSKTTMTLCRIIFIFFWIFLSSNLRITFDELDEIGEFDKKKKKSSGYNTMFYVHSIIM